MRRRRLLVERIVKDLSENTSRYLSPHNIARACGAINDERRALERLERAYQEHNPDLIGLTREPSFAGLHSSGKLKELVVDIGWRSVGLDNHIVRIIRSSAVGAQCY